MDISLKLSTPNKVLKEAFGTQRLEQIKQQMMKDKFYICACCGWEGGKEMENREHLTIYADVFNEEKPELSNLQIVCKSCYLINHIDEAIKLDFVKFVNSVYSQEELIKISWSDCSKKLITGNNRNKAIDDRKIIPLKKDRMEYLEAIKNGTASKQLKVIFTDKFLKS